MADKDTKQPVGMIEDVLLRIDKYIIPSDFIILEMSKDEKLSIILGRNFLSTTGASVVCAEGKNVFIFYNNEIVPYFPKKQESGKKYTPSAKMTSRVSALDDGQHKVHVRT
jgi:hypothetical protein